MSEKEYTAKSVEEALEKALNEMMLTRDDIEYEVIQQPSKGFLGIGKKDAVVRVKRKVIEQLKDIVDTIIEERKEEQKPTAMDTKSVVPEAESNDIVADTCDETDVQEEQLEIVENAAVETMDEVTAEEPTTTACVDEAVMETQKSMSKKDALAQAEIKGKAFLSKIFEEMKLNVTIDVKEKNGYLVFDLKGKNLGILIGRRGDTLDSLQFLLNLVINEKNSAKVKGIIDIEHYRAKREETLIGLSHKLAAKARKTGQKVVLEPMNPQERRIIHMALQNDRRVSTYSEGEEPYRKVVIVPEAKEYHRRKKENQEQA